MTYNVVFESKSDGYTGFRHKDSFSGKAEFLKSADAHDNKYSILARGVSDEEAQDLLSRTPDICFFTAAIQEGCNHQGNIDLFVLNYQLEKAARGIKRNIDHRVKNWLFLAAPYRFVEIDNQDTEKNQLYRLVKMAFTSPDGWIGDPDVAVIIINTLAKSIVAARSTDGSSQK